jgi:hypothetical protein
MRYSLWKHYRAKGMNPMEAGNHAWVDLIRYGTRSEAVDSWKSLPLNFFVPWRFGTVVSLLKQAKNHPWRTAFLVSGLEYIREATYRNTGYWWHMPMDYAFKPLVVASESGSPVELAGNLASSIGTTWLAGPGGEFSMRQLRDALGILDGGTLEPGEKERLKNAFWGISQVVNMKDEFQRGDYAGIVATAMLGAHTAYDYRPRGIFKGLPEWFPGMGKSEGVRRGEDNQRRRKALRERQQERREQRPRRPTFEERLRQEGVIR